MVIKNLAKLHRPMLGVDLGADLTGSGPRHRQCGKQVQGAGADVVMGHPLRGTGTIGSTGADRLSACTWVFSSTHSTRAFSGGSR